MRQRIAGSLIKQINDGIEKNVNNELRALDLTLSQVNVLMELVGNDKGLTVKDIQQRLHISQPTATGIVSRLEKKGLIKDSTIREDRRIKRVIITAKGLECCRNSQAAIKKSERLLFKGFTTQESERIIDLLEKVRNNIC